MTESSARRAPRLTAVRREESRVTPLELFFDLVCVLALTQCTALTADPADLDRAGPKGCSCSGSGGGPGSATRG